MQMDSFTELIKNRHSCRAFTDQLLKPEEVELLLKAALLAPSSKRKTPWHFILVEDKSMLQKLSQSKPHGAAFLAEAALAIVVVADGLLSDVWIEDASIASIYIQLQAESLGLGSCWAQIRNRLTPDETDADEYVRQLLDIPYQLQVLSIIGIGHKAQATQPFDEEKLKWEKIHIEKFTLPTSTNE